MAAIDRSRPNDAAWRRWSVVAVLGMLLTAAALGLVILPVVQGQAGGIDPYTAICRALGIAPGSPARPTPPSEAVPHPVTRVSWTKETFGQIYNADRNTGERLAKERCVACHTVEGNTPAATIPRNLGQSRFALFKQLHDFKTGTRVNETMSPTVADLDDQAIADLAAYYGALIRGQIAPQRGPPFVGAEIEDLALNGDVARGLPPCAACHGSHPGGPIETPTITGQYSEYLEAQLQAFASGARHNDIYHRMRSVAARLSPFEMKMLAIYYAGQ